MASAKPPRRGPIREPDNVPEYFVTGLADISIVDGIVRASFFAERNIVQGEAVPPGFAPTQNIVNVRLFGPLATYVAIMRMALEIVPVNGRALDA